MKHCHSLVCKRSPGRTVRQRGSMGPRRRLTAADNAPHRVNCRSTRKTSDATRLAATVTSKLEAGNFKAAVRIIPATHCQPFQPLQVSTLQRRCTSSSALISSGLVRRSGWSHALVSLASSRNVDEDS